MWTQPLIDLLESFPEISIVLSTPWVRHLGFLHTKAALPEPLRKRVIESTWHYVRMRRSGGVPSDSEDWYDNATRYEQIAWSVKCAGLSGSNWIAIDHNVDAWPAEMRHRLVKVDRRKGLSCPVSFAELKTLLVENHIVHTNPGTNINRGVPEQMEVSIEV